MNCRLMSVSSGISPLSVIAVKSWWIWYSSTGLKSLSSVVSRMGLVMSFLTILVIPSVIPSLTPISARRETFCISASSWASLLFVISGSTVLFSVLTILGGRSWCREHVSLLGFDGRFVPIERVADVARESLHSVGWVFEYLPFEYLFDLRQQRICIVVRVAADFVLVEADLQHFRQHPGPGLRADTEYCAAIHGENWGRL